MNNTVVPAYFPIALRVDGKRILIIGGGKVAARKTRFFLNKNAHIEIFADTLNKELQEYENKKQITLHNIIQNREQFIQVTAGATLIFITTSDPVYNQQVAEWSKTIHIPVCTVDNAALSSFITPSIIDRDPVQIAISTGGNAPVLGRRIRQQIEPLLGKATGNLARFIGNYRKWVKRTLSTLQERQRLWEKFLDGHGTTLLEQNRPEQAFSYLQKIACDPSLKKGEVWIVGAGPGDPDLLTLKALHVLQNADIILYDHLLSPQVFNYIRRDAVLVSVGKQKNRHTLKQDEINHHLIQYAKQGKRVLRLKGGDPFIFGRGGEEAEALVQNNIPFQIVPGISAANGCATYAGIPLTHRDCAQACLILTGHTKNGNQLELPWNNMITPNQTLVIYMGLTSLPFLCHTLIKKGMPVSWPAAAIEKGTFPDQQVITGTLESLPNLVRQSHLNSPVLIIIGQVVNHRIT